MTLISIIGIIQEETPDAKETIEELAEGLIRSRLFSSGTLEAANAIARRVGILSNAEIEE